MPITISDLISLAVFIFTGGLLVWLCQQFVFSKILAAKTGLIWSQLTTDKGLIIMSVFLLGGLIGFAITKIFVK